ncbi:hypothetical protein RC88_03245 [Pectobacterium parvum]|nr:hypothetical protein RC88_03245 [Pectobacterium parvum]
MMTWPDIPSHFYGAARQQPENKGYRGFSIFPDVILPRLNFIFLAVKHAVQGTLTPVICAVNYNRG